MAESDVGSGRLRRFARPFGTLMGEAQRGLRARREARAGSLAEIHTGALAEMGDVAAAALHGRGALAGEGGGTPGRFCSIGASP